MSFAALGPHAEQIGRRTTSWTAAWARTLRSDASMPLTRQILLLGSGHANNSSFPSPSTARRHRDCRRPAAAVGTPRGRAWIAYDDFDLESDDFEALGAAFDATGRTRLDRIGAADAHLFGQRDAVDFAVG